ncbi:MAG: phosphatidate cytidylyltransferase [Treponema sp.]|nr:phosphatidate cytidylyltransferase [Treponema sp.]
MINGGIQGRQRFITLTKELFRKSIHLCSAVVPFFLSRFYYLTIAVLVFFLLFYTVSEFLRLKGINVPVVSAVTNAAARKRDENSFVKGPVTLCLGIILTAVVFREGESVGAACYAGIYALSFGDGLASLFGKFMGKMRIPFTQGKTAAGSLACFAAIYISCFFACRSFGTEGAFIALAAATVGMFIEVLPLKDFDNIFIPLVIGAVAAFYLHR